MATKRKAEDPEGASFSKKFKISLETSKQTPETTPALYSTPASGNTGSSRPAHAPHTDWGKSLPAAICTGPVEKDGRKPIQGRTTVNEDAEPTTAGSQPNGMIGPISVNATQQSKHGAASTAKKTKFTTIPSTGSKSKKSSDEGKKWTEIEFVIHARDNNLPEPFGTRSTTTGPLPWEEVARRYNAHFSKNAKGSVRGPACEKRYRVNINEYRLRQPRYPKRSDIVYTTKSSLKRTGAQKGTSGDTYGADTGTQLTVQATQPIAQRYPNQFSTQQNPETSLRSAKPLDAKSSYKGSKKSAGPCDEELKEIGHPDYYFDYRGPVKKSEYRKVSTAGRLRCPPSPGRRWPVSRIDPLKHWPPVS